MPRVPFFKMYFLICLFGLESQTFAALECNQYLLRKQNVGLPSSLIESVKIKPLRTIEDWQQLPESTKIAILQGELDETLREFNLSKQVIFIKDINQLTQTDKNDPAIFELQAFIRSQVKLDIPTTQATIGSQSLAFEFYLFKNQILGVKFIATRFATPMKEDHPRHGHFFNVDHARDFGVRESQIDKWSVQVIFEILHGTLFVLNPYNENEFSLVNTSKGLFQ